MCKICTREDFISLWMFECLAPASDAAPSTLPQLVLLLRLQRLLFGTGMQSICKFSLLCRVCKCSSIWLLSIFRCCYRLFPFPFPFAINERLRILVRVFCVISTLERIERCRPSVFRTKNLNFLALAWHCSS